MKLHLAKFADQNAFSGYGQGHVLINGQRHEESVVVLPEALMPWSPPALEGDSLAALLSLPVEILLLGTGHKLRFPDPRVLVDFRTRGIGLEVMDTPAACRTYNILLAEGRKVGAALIIEPAAP